MPTKPINAVCTMATRECVAELALFHRALRTFHPTLPLHLGCSSEVRDAAEAATDATAPLRALRDDAHVRWVPCLDQYGPVISRTEMERQRGVWYPARHTDFMMEKANLMELAMMTTKASTPTVAFLDCDITLLRELPCVPAAAAVALSPHWIREADEAVFGAFNGGYVVASTPEVLWEWRRATQTSRYFDQASLEHVAAIFERRALLHQLPPQHNYGFWRLLQPRCGSVVDEAKRFSIAPAPPSGSGQQPAATVVHYDGAPLCSVHAHFFAPNPPRDVRLFCAVLRRWLGRCRPACAAALAPPGGGGRPRRPGRQQETRRAAPKTTERSGEKQAHTGAAATNHAIRTPAMAGTKGPPQRRRAAFAPPRPGRPPPPPPNPNHPDKDGPGTQTPRTAPRAKKRQPAEPGERRRPQHIRASKNSDNPRAKKSARHHSLHASRRGATHDAMGLMHDVPPRALCFRKAPFRRSPRTNTISTLTVAPRGFNHTPPCSRKHVTRHLFIDARAP
ncbi:hypothetical protein NXY56_000990 [Leishmania guyanensis]